MSSATTWASRLADRFWRGAAFPYREVFTNVDAAFERSQLLVRITYVMWFGFCLVAARSSGAWASPPLELLWPVVWMEYAPWQFSVYAIISVALVCSLLAAAFPGVLVLRLLTLISVVEFQGIKYSYDKINHAYHVWVFALLLLLFLPRLATRPTVAQKRAYIEVIWGIQAVALACYSVAGVQKFWGAWIDWGYGGLTLFNPDSLALHCAKVAVMGDGPGLLGWILLDYPWSGFPVMMLTLYIETVAIFIAFRPRLHALWAVALMCMHAGIGLTMNVWFDAMMLFVGMWFMLSPFAPAQFNLGAALRDLPWFGPSLAAAHARLRGARPGSRIVVFYDGECGMCNNFVLVLLRAGIPSNLYFSSQQGATWKALLAEKPWLKGIDTVAVLTEDGDERSVRVRSEAVLWTFAQLRAPLALAGFAMLVPLPLLNLGYRVIAHFRSQISRTLLHNACPLPPVELRSRFVD